MNARAYEEVQHLLAKLQLQSERIQVQNEELQAQNEEIQAQNEELQAQGEEIQAQNEDLQRQTTQLHQQAGTLKEADTHKNEFLGLLAHELRNPLTPIANCVELLNRRSSDPRAIAKVGEILGRQARHMTHLIDDLLDVTRVARGKVALQRERLNVTELVNQCMDDQRDALDRAGLVLVADLPEVPIHVDGDHTRICQVLSNLLANAVKFCPAGSTVSVRVTLDAPERRVAIHVADTGAGIEPALLSRVFEPFYQADHDLAHSKGGLGLGLALAKGLVELHGGRIEARSDGKGRGAEFVVSLPLAETGEPVATAGEREVTSLPPRQGLSARVLMIDDNADAADTLAELLELEGCQVEVANTGRSGIEAALRFAPDVILCDIGLPGMDGYALVRELRQHPQLRSVLLVALTGYSSPADQLRATEAGFDMHLAKPPDFARVVEILRHPTAAQREASGSSSEPA
jgi:signal transduction histidine kinase/ActR/RegA family two-component response regulator